MNFQSILRHQFTAAAGIATMWLIAALTLSAEDAQKLTDAFKLLIEPLIVIVGILAVAVWRIFLAKAGSAFRRGAGETDTNSGGGLSPCIMGFALAAGLVVGALPSCSPTAAKAWPITFHLKGPDGDIGYSSKGGLVITGTVRGTK